MNFKTLEEQPKNTTIPTETILEHLTFNDQGLIPAIAQQHDTGEVLMMAWMNKASILETLKTKHVCYWSRSRQTFWRKGESSGNRQTLKSMHADCDGDTLLIKVHQKGAACHTLRRDCFYVEMGEQESRITSDPL